VVLSREEMIASYTSDVEFALNIVYGLLGAAVIIAIFGVVNTMALSVLERTREIGVFRAVGANRRLVRRSIRRESIIIASYGGLLGVLVGILLGGVMQHVLLGTPILSLTVPPPFVVGALGGMVLVGVLAAWWPARRAARIDVLRAIAAV
jgi:putative ABC transport system permease protein